MRDLEVAIRPLELSDAPAIEAYASDERVASTTTTPHPYPADGAITFAKSGIEAWRKGEGFSFAITADSEMIGVVELGVVDHEKRIMQCDYAIAASHWGRGITTRAVGLALRYAFQELEMNAVRAACLQRNPASARILEKNGFRETQGFIYNSSKFKNEPGRQFKLSRQEWLTSSARDSN